MRRTPAEPNASGGRRDRALAELFLVLRFGLIGGLATGIHILVLWVLLSGSSLPVLLANTVAFLGAFGFSFAGNYFWTFRASGSLGQAMLRFLIVSASAFLLNSALLAAILWSGRMDSTVAALGSAAVIPVITFLASRFWAFQG